MIYKKIMPMHQPSHFMVDHRNLISNALANFPVERHTLALAAMVHGSPVFVLGRNQYAVEVLEHLNVEGIIDDFAPQHEIWNGKHIYKSEDLPAGAIVINCAMSISPLRAQARLSALPGVRQLAYAELCHLIPGMLPLPDFVVDTRRAFETSEDRLQAIFSRLYDETSRQVFNRVMSYRLTGDSRHMEGFTVRLRDQYFEPFTGVQQRAVFVDCGGFDGDTTEEFILRYPEYARIFLFEPSPSNLALARERLAGRRDIEFIELGVSNTAGELYFDANQGSASTVSSNGQLRIRTTTLDVYLPDPVSFIKMDLEGWELQALQGARRHISTDNAVLAIAVYHATTDFWNIPEYILSINPDYEIFLRHYTEGWSETVMYFVPKKKTHHDGLIKTSIA